MAELTLSDQTNQTVTALQDANTGLRSALSSALQRAAEAENQAAQLREAETRLRTLNATAPVGIFQLDPDGLCTYANPRWQEITGRPLKEALGLAWVATIHPDDREAVLADRAENLRDPHESSIETRLVTPQGQVRWVHARVAPMFHDGAQLAGWVGTLEDITERRQAEDALRAANEELRVYARIVEESPDFISVVDRHYVYRMVNPTYTRLNDVPADQLLGHTPADIIGDEVFEKVIRPQLDRCFAGETVRYGAWFDYRAAGRRFMEVRYYPLYIDHQVEYAVVVGRDTTQRKQAEDTLRESQEHLRAVYEATPAAIVVTTLANGRYVEANGSFEGITGYGRDEAAGRTSVELGILTPEERARFAKALQDEGVVRNIEIHLRTRSGEERIALASAALIDVQGERCILTVATDITERVRTREALHESEERYRRLVELSPDAIAVHQDGTVVYLNASGARLLHASGPEQIVGRPTLSVVHPDCTPLVRERIRRLLEHPDEPTPMVELVFVRLDGSTVDVEVTASAITYQGRPAVQAIGRDITERKHAEAEREALLQQLREAGAAKDQFLSVLSHELRNPLAPILAGVFALRRQMPDDDRIRRTLEIIERNAKLQARLVDDLLDLSRIARGKMQFEWASVPLDAVVNAAAEDQRDEAEKAGLALTVSAAPGLWVLGDPARLQQAVLNLVTNAIKFTPSGGEIRVASCPHDTQQARIVVEDTGIGIDHDFLGCLFEMFRQGEVGGRRRPGLGIGLALVKSIVEAHRGRVWAESEGPGKGSRFTIELPLTVPEGPAPDGRERDAASRSLSVLVVEDNPDALTLLADSLSLMGHSVRTAPSAEDALEQLRRGRPDVILADIGLPGMDGYEFLQRARETPGLERVPAFAITGFGQEEDVRRAHEAGYTCHFVKPVDMDALERRIRELSPH